MLARCHTSSILMYDVLGSEPEAPRKRVLMTRREVKLTVTLAFVQQKELIL